MVFSIFGCRFAKKTKNKVSARFMKSLTIVKILSAFWQLPLILKVVPKPACDPENYSESRPRHLH